MTYFIVQIKQFTTVYRSVYQYLIELKVAVLAFGCVRGTYGTCPSYFCGICTPLTEVGGRVRLHSAHRRDLCVPSTRRIWQTQLRCCIQNLELFTATSPFANHQPTTVPVRAQNSSLQTHLHVTFTSENY